VSDLDQEQPFISHLLELRTRLLWIIGGVLLVFLVLLPFSNPIYELLARPLLAQMPKGNQMVAIDPMSPFMAPVKLTLIVALFVAIPWVFYQVWGFIAPGLYQHEKRLILPLLVSSTALFYCGIAFAYYVILPMVFAFITTTAPAGVAVMTDINKYLDFVLTMFMAFGVAFEVPIATVILVLIGVTTPEALVAQRSYVFVGAFIVAALLPPTDIVSQTLIALPIWLLFEAGVFFSRFVLRQRSAASPESTSLDRYDHEA
jgi:sec-independent protein translocase protein TatC